MNLEFQFESLSDFWLMSGHGPYVWAAYAITIAGLACLIIHARRRKKQVLKKIRVTAVRTQDTRK